MSVEGMVAAAERSLGLREPNHIQQWYRDRNGSAFGGNFAWCNAAITYWAVQAGEHANVCFGTDYAYTVWHAQRFKTVGQWHTDVKGIRRGDIVFFDWAGTNEIGKIDHIGIVTGVSGGNVYTIEGNTENVCARRVRSAVTIVGYGRPKYKTATTPPAAGTGTYKVKDGDTLGEIAEAHKTTVKILADLNGIKDSNKIDAGQVLKLPASATPQRVVSLSKLIKAAKTDPPKKGTPVSYAAAKYVEQALVAEGLLAAGYADGHMGTATRSAYALYQQRRGYQGKAADGIPGKATLTKLGAKHGFTVVA
ncbi:LysM peptidoglycan-binding domain-containing protein [Streptomyces sp. NBC_01725]|uniref:LysM peptidoglycan-binding domain-containing protein n=1 Tax=Streptomyces sp. NBC_01725 TaxID=2975923 RepID=UPI002E2E04E0|nr:LysM peptidoglycan-binding domain-containing protein [Streptomyces sp. NBC_01725]